MLKVTIVAGVVVSVWAISAGAAAYLFGCGLHQPAPNAEREKESGVVPESARATIEAEGDAHAVIRVGGDLEARVEYVEGEFRSGACRIPTPLPDGYPAPTPPGAIELKQYPMVRRAEISGRMWPDWGMNLAFFPLFNHIKRREIAMTAPVEMNYVGMSSAGAPESWTMSFLYRTAELGPAGVDPKDGRILVEDIPPLTVAAIGIRGPYKLELVKGGTAKLRAWLAQQSEWKEAGDARALFYNGPEVRKRDQWWEAQIPLARR